MKVWEWEKGREKNENPCYFNKYVVNAIIGKQDLPERHSTEYMVATMFEYILTKQGLEIYGKWGEQATERELAQINSMNALQLFDINTHRGWKEKSKCIINNDDW